MAKLAERGLSKSVFSFNTGKEDLDGPRSFFLIQNRKI